ncbi:MAG: class I SAM-dependent RNA methyltransferase [Chthoniobacterales bacterium]
MKKPNSEVTLHIESLAYGGSGVARHEGKVWFVPHTIPGERIIAKAQHSKKSYVQARLVRVLTPSPDRVEAPCQHYTRCGGCSYQHIRYEEQIHWKTTQVQEAFQRIGKIHTLPKIHTIAAPHPLHYRNRIRLHIQDGKPGFLAQGGHGFIPIRRCEIASESINQRLSRLQRHHLTGEHLTLRDRQGHQDPQGQNQKGFYQTNDTVAALLLAEVEDFLKTSTAPHLLEAYCGAGAFAKKLRPHFQKIIGIDWSEPAIENANKDAQENEHYLCADVAKVLSEQLTAAHDTPTELLLDPPREGLEKTIIPNLLAANHIVGITYVSCNPTTLARDCALLQEKFSLSRLSVLDMFPQTASIETIVRLLRR